MFAFYNFLFFFALALCSPYLFLRGLIGRHGIKARLGIFPKGTKEKFQGKKVLWFHAASVGEVLVLETIFPLLKEKDKNLSLIVSTVTKTGKHLAQKVLTDVELIFNVPLDLPCIVRKTINQLNPQALILVETELWPNLIKESKKKGIFVGLINGRISPKSFSGYNKFKSFFKEVFTYIDIFCMQSEDDAQRILKLGAQKEKIVIVENLKFDLMLRESQSIDRDLLRKKLRIENKEKVLIAGSIREGEEGIIINLWKNLREKGNNLKLILAPRHLKRLKKIEQLLYLHNLDFVRKSRLKRVKKKDFEIILLDTMGELSQLYSIADIAFVGGSLTPTGGHNLLEPARFSVPVLFGPHIENFRTIAQTLLNSSGGIMVQDGDELLKKILELLADEEKRKNLGRNAQKAIQEKSGGSSHVVEILLEKI